MPEISEAQMTRVDAVLKSTAKRILIHPCVKVGLKFLELSEEEIIELIRPALDAATAELRAEVERLRDYKADVENATKLAMSEECTADEQHCTCVPLLRAEVKRLQALCWSAYTSMHSVSPEATFSDELLNMLARAGGE